MKLITVIDWGNGTFTLKADGIETNGGGSDMVNGIAELCGVELSTEREYTDPSISASGDSPVGCVVDGEIDASEESATVALAYDGYPFQKGDPLLGPFETEPGWEAPYNLSWVKSVRGWIAD